ncbi:MAG TPA: L-seryl-tRNA(Sec) selenium transferase, partial [Dehalococcoidia bacterium]|nr:L-seryl-tRNA(Sec) selenium transferase [Dehalococcoidia bacterium]
MSGNELKHLPSVDRVISHKRLRILSNHFPQKLIVEHARRILELHRQKIKEGGHVFSLDQMVEEIVSDMESLCEPSLRPVINATGVILHTNLGRAVLSSSAIKAMESVSSSYSNLEFDISKGSRGSRHVHVEKVICEVTGAESALVVNNNAAAVLLCLTALAKRKEVIVSRGEAVEIGGGFRVPDVMKQSGARLVEIGTTNCTYIEDYEKVISPRTAILLRVHPSNFRIEGFTHRVELAKLVALGREYSIPVIDDQGSGCLLDTAKYSGLQHETTVQRILEAGVSLVCFSGDKLIGGPQAGIIAGKRIYIDKLKKHPLARAIRIDKIRLAAIWATFLHYLQVVADNNIPLWQMISMETGEIYKRARDWAGHISDYTEVIDGYSVIGGGSLPGES